MAQTLSYTDGSFWRRTCKQITTAESQEFRFFNSAICTLTRAARKPYAETSDYLQTNISRVISDELQYIFIEGQGTHSSYSFCFLSANSGCNLQVFNANAKKVAFIARSGDKSPGERQTLSQFVLALYHIRGWALGGLLTYNPSQTNVE